MKADRNKPNASIVALIVLAIISVIVLIVAIVMTFKVSKVGENQGSVSDSATTTQAPVSSLFDEMTTTAPGLAENTTAALVDGTTQQAQDGTTQSQQQATNPSQMSNQQMIDNMMSAVAQVSGNASFTGRKQQKINIQMVDCSIPAIISTANKIIQRLAGDTDITFKFANGTATDTQSGDTSTTSSTVPPTDKTFTLDPKGLVSLTAEQNGSNTVYTAKLIPESTSLSSPVPYYHAMAMDYLDLASVDVSPAKITQADMNYSGATVKVTVDGNGKIVGYYEYMPVAGTGTGKVIGLSASATIEGYLEETWTFTW